jgi:hypothetical protein
MKLSKEVKKFWQRHFRIEKLEDIPKEMPENGLKPLKGTFNNLN